MIRWFQKGQFPIDRLIKFYPVSQIVNHNMVILQKVNLSQVGDFEKAIHDMENGSTIKPVLIW